MQVTNILLCLVLGFGTTAAFVVPAALQRRANPVGRVASCSAPVRALREASRRLQWHEGSLGLRSMAHGHSKAVVPLNTEHDFDSALVDKKLVFVELYGTHCRKCFAVTSKFSHLAEHHAQPDTVTFAKIACDKAADIAKRLGVSKVPTFQVYMDGKKVDELVGAEAIPVVAKKVKQLVQQWVAVASSDEERTAAQAVLDQYHGADADAAPDAGAAADACGAEGCEIVWD